MPLPFSFKVQYFEELPSTNSYAREQAKLGAGEGMVYTAGYQTGGRGRFDRKWLSSPGKNLLFSILLRPPISPREAPMVTQIACRSVAEVLQHQYGLTCTIKRPNDVLVQGRKICGILVESSSNSPKKVEDVIIGVGLNVNEAPRLSSGQAGSGVQPEAISMKDVLGKDLDPREVLKHILEQLENDLVTLYAHPTGHR